MDSFWVVIFIYIFMLVVSCSQSYDMLKYLISVQEKLQTQICDNNKHDADVVVLQRVMYVPVL